MTTLCTVYELADIPVAQVMVPVISATIISIAAAVTKMVFDVASLKRSVDQIITSILDIKNDKDTMKWSTYYRRERKRGPRRRRHNEAP